uniref:Uncharacterized protein n=1 Tax=Lepeophtheirus salmonis TaxID=72036 RepID=A0A0K2UQ05_LEPSM
MSFFTVAHYPLGDQLTHNHHEIWIPREGALMTLQQIRYTPTHDFYSLLKIRTQQIKTVKRRIEETRGESLLQRHTL